VTENGSPEEVLFYEQGASWLWVLAGPAAGIAMALIQMSAGYGFQWLVPTVFFVLVSGFLWIQVKAARIHTSVELTPEYLRQGT
jgi:p-aminobenzoyl-glutamate transporter AbgT